MNPKPTEQINFVGVGVTILALAALSLFVDIEALKGWVTNAGVWAPLLFILLKISTIVIAPLSGSPLYPLVGLLFGFWPGFLYATLGDFLGYTLTFFISRLFGRAMVLKFIAGNEEGMLAKIVERIGSGKGFFYACLTFFAIPELLSYGAGLSKLPYWKFILILWPASTVVSASLVFFGSAIDLTNKSFLVSSAVPLLIGACLMALGGWFFLRGLKKAEVREGVQKN